MACRTDTEYGDITLEGLKKELESYKEISKVEGINSLPTNAKQVAKVKQKLNLANMFMLVSYAETEKFEYAKVSYTSGRNYGVKLVASDVGTVYEFPEVKPFDAEEWDKTASDEDLFEWDEVGTTIVGYKENLARHEKIRIPSKCIGIKPNSIWIGSSSRNVTSTRSKKNRITREHNFNR